jgi:hypothetical protein
VGAVPRADVETRVGEFAAHEVDDPVGRLGLVDAHADDPRLFGARRAQHVATRAVAEIDAEAEARRLADALGAGVDDRRIDRAGEEHLRDHLPEAPEADDEHLAAGALEILLDLVAGRGREQMAAEPDRERRERHRQGDDRGDERRLGGP